MSKAKKVAVVGTGYVGLVTGVSLSIIGHDVTCVDVDQERVARMQMGESPIYEPGLESLMVRNSRMGRLRFTSHLRYAFAGVDVIYLAVETSQNEDGTTDLRMLEAAVADIAANVTESVVVVIKSTVPVGTTDHLKSLLEKATAVPIEVVSNPAFLREGLAIHDAFYAERIVIGASSEAAGDLLEEMNEPFGIPIYRTDVRSAEMIKYASNAFLATKVDFMNEVANVCEKLGANIEEVAHGMGRDARMAQAFLNTGVGYGGSCFQKDAQAWIQAAGNGEVDATLLRSMMEATQKQQVHLVTRAKEQLGSLRGKRVALLGLALKPNTDDMSEASSVMIAEELVHAGAEVIAFDPGVTVNVKRGLPNEVVYANSVDGALATADIAFVLEEWGEVKEVPLTRYKELLRDGMVFDGRNCYSLEEAKEAGIAYYSIGRPAVEPQLVR